MELANSFRDVTIKMSCSAHDLFCELAGVVLKVGSPVASVSLKPATSGLLLIAEE